MKTWPQNGAGAVDVFAFVDVLIVCPQSPLKCLAHGRHTYETIVERSTNTKKLL